MQYFKRIIIIFILLTALPSCSYEQKPGPQGKLVFEESYFEFGKVTEGDIIKHGFPFKNEGPGSVRLVKTLTSCGCTTAEAALREYGPGESGMLEVVVDTKGKRGIMVKTVEVFMENADQDKHELSVVAELIPPLHPKVGNVLSITKDPECKSCHLDSGVGQKAGFLYHRVCAQCHGKKGKGASARALNDAKWLNNVDDNYVRNAIAEGLPEDGMPPYVEGVSPPLTVEQVDSLIEYIRSLR
jgi:hypothetical protein|tara:strand:+ start:2137 stop:2862 length:726 start_codon:yes stop_codon:yes gene_type:complete